MEKRNEIRTNERGWGFGGFRGVGGVETSSAVGRKNFLSDITRSLFLYAKHFVNGIDDIGCLWQTSSFQGFRIRHRSINACHSPHWGIEMEECFVLHDASANLRSDSCKLYNNWLITGLVVVNSCDSTYRFEANPARLSRGGASSELI